MKTCSCLRCALADAYNRWVIDNPGTPPQEAAAHLGRFIGHFLSGAPDNDMRPFLAMAISVSSMLEVEANKAQRAPAPEAAAPPSGAMH